MSYKAIEEKWFMAVDYASNYGNYRTRSVGGTGNFNFTFYIPADFGTLVSMEAICIPTATNNTGARALTSAYGAVGEGYTTHGAVQLPVTVNFILNQFDAMDLSGVFTNISAGDICSININHAPATGTVHYVGIRLRYKPI